MFNRLALVQKDGNYYVDSREVAELIGKQHGHLMRDIRGYALTLGKVTQSKIGVSDFFVESSYFDSTGRTLPCYLLTKMGCEMVANKLTGEKGVLFTAAYVSQFNAMENYLRTEREKMQAMKPTLSDCNDTAQIIIEQLRRTGASTYRVLEFLDELYRPLGVELLHSGEFADVPHTFTALQIAYIFGMYSLYGNPHAQAVSCILNDHLLIGTEHKIAVSDDCLDGITGGHRYDKYALEKVHEWLSNLCYPTKIYSVYRTYHVVYRRT